jgi:hypothetical protein
MLGTLAWVVCGVVAGCIMNRIISENEKGLVAMTLSVGSAAQSPEALSPHFSVVGMARRSASTRCCSPSRECHLH